MSAQRWSQIWSFSTSTSYWRQPESEATSAATRTTNHWYSRLARGFATEDTGAGCGSHPARGPGNEERVVCMEVPPSINHATPLWRGVSGPGRSTLANGEHSWPAADQDRQIFARLTPYCVRSSLPDRVIGVVIGPLKY